jgi:hypothetical protein
MISTNRCSAIILRPNIVRRTLDIDADTDARLREMADERGQDVAAVLAEAVALLDSWSISRGRISAKTAVGRTLSGRRAPPCRWMT